MDMDRRTVLKSTGGIVAASALAGCLGGDDGPAGDAEYWHDLSDSEEESAESWISQFEDETDLEISISAVGDLEDRVETAVAAGEGPEMWTWAHDWVGNHWERDFLADVSDDLTIDINEEFSDPAVEAITPTGTDATVALPAGGETVSLLYNTELVDEPPETLEEMIEIAEEYDNPQQGEYGFTQPVDVYFISWALQAYGSRIFELDDDGGAHLGLDDDEMHDGMALFRDLYEYMPADLEYDAQVNPFINGNAPFTANGPWAIGDFAGEDIEFEVAPWPEIDDGEAAPYTGIDVWYFSDMVNEDEDRKDATIEFIEWMTTTDEIVEYYADEHSFIPVVSEVNEDGLSDNVIAFQQSFDQGVPMPGDARMNLVWEPLEDAVTAVLTDDGDIEEEFAAAGESIRDDEDWE